jgi:sulfate adenylyltransferase subunit 1
MVTGASTANAAIILIDARNGVIEQTRRHTYIASLLRIPHVLVCINKMDLVDWSEARFDEIRAQFREMAAKIADDADVHFLPISALKGDNVVDASQNMPWYGGPTLLGLLETLPIENDLNRSEARFPVQYVVRPMREEYHDYRGYAGRVAGGVLHVGDAVKILPSGLTSTIAAIESADGPLEAAFAPMSVTIRLADDIDISRGDMIVTGDCVPDVTQDMQVVVCWLSDKPLQPGGRYAVKHTTRDARCVIKAVDYKLDITTLDKVEGAADIGSNDIARLTLKTTVPLCIDSYRRNRDTGSLILIDEATNVTVGACMIDGLA